MSTCPDIPECNRSGCKGCADTPDHELALQVFLASSKELHAQMRRDVRHARQWTLFWFVCWAISVAFRVLETRP